ncbi:MAG TPA: copper chaperone PCu(A)C [Rhizobiaceae bacterium]|nr:copper chaperone PCu(A)C [Rhizobiaceae bacterium]
MTRRLSLPFAAAVLLTIIAIYSALWGKARAEETASVTVGNIEISDGWARAMLPGQPSGGGFLTIINKGGGADRLVGASSPSAGKVEVHNMEVVNDVMTMRPVEDGLEVPAGAAVALRPGGLHLMFMKVSEPFKDGSVVPLSLEFEKAGKVDVSLPVRKPGASSAQTTEHSGHGAAH